MENTPMGTDHVLTETSTADVIRAALTLGYVWVSLGAERPVLQSPHWRRTDTAPWQRFQGKPSCPPGTASGEADSWHRPFYPAVSPVPTGGGAL